MDWDGRPYFPLSLYLKQRFGCRVYRVSLDAGFSCPVREKGSPCIFCDSRGSRASYVDPTLPLEEQLKRGMELMRKRFKAKKFIAYFQAFTNTYAPVEKLKEIYSRVFFHPDVVAMSVSTRPDCLDQNVVDLLAEFNRKKPVWVEVGVQTFNLNGLIWLERRHGVWEIIDAVQRLKKAGIEVIAHMIIGVPTDNEEWVRENARVINVLGFNGVKLHNLYVLKGTKLEELYLSGQFKVLSLEEYAKLAGVFISNLSPTVVVHRIAGKAEQGLVAPDWTGSKASVSKIEELFKKWGVYQGKDLH